MAYAAAVVERTMKVQEVMMQAISGKLTWLQAEEILGWQPRRLRRWRLRYQRRGYDGLWDRRRHRPSPRRAPVAEVGRIVRLYRERYTGFNAAHFHEIAQREHCAVGSWGNGCLSLAGYVAATAGAGHPPLEGARSRVLSVGYPHPLSWSLFTVSRRLLARASKAPPLSQRKGKARYCYPCFLTCQG